MHWSVALDLHLFHTALQPQHTAPLEMFGTFNFGGMILLLQIPTATRKMNNDIQAVASLTLKGYCSHQGLSGAT